MRNKRNRLIDYHLSPTTRAWMAEQLIQALLVDRRLGLDDLLIAAKRPSTPEGAWGDLCTIRFVRGEGT